MQDQPEYTMSNSTCHTYYSMHAGIAMLYVMVDNQINCVNYYTCRVFTVTVLT